MHTTLTAVETWDRPAIGPSLASPKSESVGLKFSSNNTLDDLKSRNITFSMSIMEVRLTMVTGKVKSRTYHVVGIR